MIPGNSHRNGIQIVWLAILLALTTSLKTSGAEEYASHPPIRPLPKASNRPLGSGPTLFVDASKGSNANDGTKDAPFATVMHALAKAKPGDTIVLRGGTYYESLDIRLQGTPQQPITLCPFPGEMAMVDAGLREFAESPATAWEPVPDGGPEEFRSTKSYDRCGGFGNFADSMIPFQRYLTFHDLRSTNELWHSGLSNRADDPIGIYAGPGVRRDATTGRVHIRLSHTQLAGLGEHHYRGETDPRKIPLVIAGDDYAIRLFGAKHIRLQDLVVRGAERSAVSIEESQEIELDGMTLYGSGSALRTRDVDGLKLINSNLRGHAAPWHSRGHHKDRAGAGYLAICEGDNFEFAHCEFTDHHDGLLMQRVRTMSLHHSLVDNFNDDGIEPGPKHASRHIEIFRNRISRCLTTFTAHGSHTIIPHEPGSGVYIFRNVVDVREGIYKGPSTEADPTGSFLNRTCRVCSDHGSPTWAVYYIYQNTFVIPENTYRNYYGFGWGAHMGDTTRRVFNNIFVQVDGLPGLVFAADGADLQADGNLLWGMNEGPRYEGDFFSSFRKSKPFLQSREVVPPGWGANDVFGDPKFVRFEATAREPADFRLNEGSAAVNAGRPIPADWPDPLRDEDAGAPDIGAFPLGAEQLQVGPQAR